MRTRFSESELLEQTLDGADAVLPAFITAPDGDGFLRERGLNFYPDSRQSDLTGDIGGGLHDEYSLRYRPRRQALQP